MSKEGGYIGWILGVLGVIVIGFLIFAGVNSYENWIARTTTDVTFTVTGKEVKSDGDDDSKYLIYTKGEVFEDTDAPHFNKYNSSDVYGELEIGKTYNCQVFGERDPRWSWYRNIVSCDEVKS